jgi:hypothetical protein
MIFMEGLHFTAGGQQREMDAILVLNHDNPSYPTKLYLAENVGCGLNWNETAYLLGRNWHTFSWAHVPTNMSPFEILADHLIAMRIPDAA